MLDGCDFPSFQRRCWTPFALANSVRDVLAFGLSLHSSAPLHAAATQHIRTSSIIA
jgi:hypothetical protein